MRVNKKEVILEIASKHFSKAGFASASLEEIASEAEITKPAIYYHFKDKSALYEAVLLKHLEPLAKRVEEAVSLKTDVEDKLVAYIEAFGEFLNERSCFAAVLTHEFADNGENLPESATVQLAKMLGVLTSIINEGVDNRVFKTENPMIVQMMIVSPLIMHQTTQKMRQKVAKHVTGDFKVLPEPDIKDMAKILSKKIIFALKGATYE
ncbi:TetR/AcrR family transcriptional regulator [Hydrogenimonas thermophila]|uniref:Transcriptional regulator, TetR family n=1 Tax=Hydrogenimonas thermophila TaxID=223786 RepID=A0A1I5QAT2_9BACT|nr:TetR/AcrR family transcriptional regulator [Hydrogenimonas thermophila]WOE70838.1 TetR/AcrR family transcriptional regulator [Hydrogenimonas thermophila]WOE73356.1 TetR/AcrR family transcriptional regulator [Hydrogenimonas thermophila]SFP43365.1 transcriptional regulator, TetR family [Hydrogenimonas thermophila]